MPSRVHTISRVLRRKMTRSFLPALPLPHHGRNGRLRSGARLRAARRSGPAAFAKAALRIRPAQVYNAPEMRSTWQAMVEAHNHGCGPRQESRRPRRGERPRTRPLVSHGCGNLRITCPSGARPQRTCWISEWCTRGCLRVPRESARRTSMTTDAFVRRGTEPECLLMRTCSSCRGRRAGARL